MAAMLAGRVAGDARRASPQRKQGWAATLACAAGSPSTRHPLLVALALFVAGCEGGGGAQVRERDRDPILGERPVPVAGAAPIPPPGTNTAQTPLPAITAPSAATSPAALATGAVPTIGGNRDLQADTQPVPGAAASAATLGKPESAAPPAPVPVVQPVPVLQPAKPITLAGGAPGPVATVDEGLRLLQTKGAKSIRLELQKDTNLWRCTCSIPDPQNPTFKRVYDCPSSDCVSAVRAVIDKVERENR